MVKIVLEVFEDLKPYKDINGFNRIVFVLLWLAVDVESTPLLSASKHRREE